jgi:putative CocE/NonD family hydrolase
MAQLAHVKNLWGVRIPMRDGINLVADLYFPPASDSERLPALLHRTPYNKQNPNWVGQARYLASHGYVVVLQDVRGRQDSEGNFYPFRDEGPDGFDSIEWIAQQPWCNGRVGMFGGSYGAWVQWAAAREVPPHLTTIIPASAPALRGTDVPYNNGMIDLIMFSWLHHLSGRGLQDNSLVDWERVFWHLPVREMSEALGRPLPVWEQWLANPGANSYWDSIGLSDEDSERISVPVLHINAWFDPVCHFDCYEAMMLPSSRRHLQSMIVGPWNHEGTRFPKEDLGGVNFTSAAVLDVDRIHVEWFDHWMRGEGDTSLLPPKCKYFVTGANEWREADHWPPPNHSSVDFYLAGSGPDLRASRGLDSGVPASESTSVFRYDPADPVISMPDFDFFPAPPALQPDIPFDQQALLSRNDCAVYTGSQLADELEIAGKAELMLFAESSCPDTDWMAILADVYPDGRSMRVTEAFIRARFRNSLREAELMVAGSIYQFDLVFNPIAHVFKPGHCVRVTITSSYFPRYDRNLNTGKPIGSDADPVIAVQTIHHGPTNPSKVRLPVRTAE